MTERPGDTTWPFLPEEIALQQQHDERREADPKHDPVSCVCCCWDCDDEWEARTTKRWDPA